MLMGAFAKAFDVEAPALEDLTADEALAAFRAFTAACMEAALADEEVAAAYRASLGAEARALGRKVRAAAPIGSEQAFLLVRFFYRGIGIELSGERLGAMVDERLGAMAGERPDSFSCYPSGERPGAMADERPCDPSTSQAIAVRFGPCSFSQRYTPEDCRFMSAFDEGFMCGIMGIEGDLRFECRLTEGAACCRARLG